MKRTDALIIIGALFLVGFLGLVHLNRVFPSMVRGYALDKIMDDLNPSDIRYIDLEGQQFTPDMYQDISFDRFKYRLERSGNKTIILDEYTVYLKNPEIERYYRYTIRVSVQKGFPLCKCTWYNPISDEQELYGWVIIQGFPHIIWVDD